MDITLCTYLGCPVRDKCRRGKYKNLSKHQIIIDNPSKIVNGKFECDMFLGDEADLLLAQLQSIVNSKK